MLQIWSPNKSCGICLKVFVLVLLIPGSHALPYNGIFCNDLSPSSLSIEALALDLPLTGSHWSSLEQLTSKRARDLFRPIYTIPCLADKTPSRTCVLELRKLFVEKWTLYTGIDGTSREAKTEARHFRTYIEQSQTFWTVMTRKTFRASCVIVCHGLFHSPEKMDVYNATCPDPCLTQMACPPTECHKTGIFAHEYWCECGTDKIWDIESYACLPREMYDLRRGKPHPESVGLRKCYGKVYCNLNGTLFCRQDVENQRHFCICKPHYQGTRCDETVDACKNRIMHPYLPNGGLLIAGNQACKINVEGNVCHAFITEENDPAFSCHCGSPEWSPDPSLPYDNCFKRRSMCDSVICVHGKCVTSASGFHPYCVCDSGYSGSMCDEWTGTWTNWSPWDKCRPACGSVRYSIRFRDCQLSNEEMDDRRMCVGAPIEYQQCAAHPCTKSEGSFLTNYFTVRQSAIASSLSTAAVITGLITVLWIVLLRTTLVTPLRILLQKWRWWFAFRYRRPRATITYDYT
ncbi:unnamed protein product [Dicrocoelium dendriticum]|nr:unnamed protein product [Dicrocoelium dendriticum]